MNFTLFQLKFGYSPHIIPLLIKPVILDNPLAPDELAKNTIGKLQLDIMEAQDNLKNFSCCPNK